MRFRFRPNNIGDRLIIFTEITYTCFEEKIEDCETRSNRK